MASSSLQLTSPVAPTSLSVREPRLGPPEGPCFFFFRKSPHSSIAKETSSCLSPVAREMSISVQCMFRCVFVSPDGSASVCIARMEPKAGSVSPSKPHDQRRRTGWRVTVNTFYDGHGRTRRFLPGVAIQLPVPPFAFLLLRGDGRFPRVAAAGRTDSIHWWFRPQDFPTTMRVSNPISTGGVTGRAHLKNRIRTATQYERYPLRPRSESGRSGVPSFPARRESS